MSTTPSINSFLALSSHINTLFVTEDKAAFKCDCEIDLSEYTDVFYDIPLTKEQISLIKYGVLEGRSCAVIVTQEEIHQLPNVVINNVQIPESLGKRWSWLNSQESQP